MTKKKEVAAKVVEPIEAPPITMEQIDARISEICAGMIALNEKASSVIYERCERCHKKN